MAQISITVPNASLARVVTAVCGFFRYQAIITPPVGDPFPNPETPNQFAQRMLAESVKSWVKTYESYQAAETARTAANADADLIGIT